MKAMGKKKETETADIYDEEQREAMLDEDEISEAEYAFMAGRDMKRQKKKQKWKEHSESTSVALAEEEYQED
jgi:hypothetical protein